MGPIETTLRAAHALLEKGWTQGADVRNEDGNPLDLRDEGATCFCYSGAIAHAEGEDSDEYFEALMFVRAHSDRIDGLITIWNDARKRTQAEVLAENQRMIDRAAELGV